MRGKYESISLEGKLFRGHWENGCKSVQYQSMKVGDFFHVQATNAEMFVFNYPILNPSVSVQQHVMFSTTQYSTLVF